VIVRLGITFVQALAGGLASVRLRRFGCSEVYRSSRLA